MHAAHVLILAALLGLPACAFTHQAYPGPERPRSEVALVRTVATRRYEVEVFAVDGRSVRGSGDLNPRVRHVTVLPGEHAFEVFVFASNLVSLQGLGRTALSFEVRAGGTYRLEASDERGLRVWAVDADSGEVLIEQTFPEGRISPPPDPADSVGASRSPIHGHRLAHPVHPAAPGRDPHGPGG